jgi:hypothetical protein
MRNSIFGTVLFLMSLNAYAAIVDNGTYLTDTDVGLDWLKLSETAGLSFSQVEALTSGVALDEWSIATQDDMALLSANAIGLYDDWWGVGFAGAGDVMYDNLCDFGIPETRCIAHINGDSNFSLVDWVVSDDEQRSTLATGVIRLTQYVPVPPTIWLFGSGLIGLIGLARRKKV